MDRYVIREARGGASYPQGNQMMAFSPNGGRNNMIPQENVYYGGSYVNQFPSMQHVSNSSFVEVGNMNAPGFGQNIHPVQNQMMTGIDPRYLANYSDNSAQYIVTGQPMQSETGHVSNDPSFGFNYQNRSFVGPEKNKPKSFTPQVISNAAVQCLETPKNISFESRANSVFQPKHNMQQIQQNPVTVTPKVAESKVPKKENQNQIMSRSARLQELLVRIEKALGCITLRPMGAEHQWEMLQNRGKLMQTKLRGSEEQLALHKSGPRAFSGPVEKVLKWHKALQDIGVFVFYEIVAKCVSVRPGEACAKNLVIRDDNGPAMQVVYYEVDFLLAELKVPSTVRVIGRMMAGTCRLQAFSVRVATGDDVATLPRRAAVAAHHVAKLCKEYGINV